MKKALWVVVIGILFNASPVWATWTVGNHVSARSTTGVGPTTAGIDTTGNHAIVVGIVNASGCNTVPHDNKNSDSAWTSSIAATFAGFTATIWTLNSEATFGASHTFQALTTGCLNYASIFAVGLNSASATSGPLTDQTSTASTSGVSLTVGAITPTQDNEIVFSLFGIGIVDGSGFAINSGYTIAEHQDQGDFNQGGALAYKIQTSAATVNPQWTWVNTGSAMAVNASLFDRTGVACTVAGQTYTASTAIGLQACFDQATHDGDSVHLTAGFHATTQFTWTAPPNSRWYGDTVCTGSGNPASANLSCTDNTEIIDDYNPGNQSLSTFVINIPSSGTFTMDGLSFETGTAEVHNNGTLLISGTNHSFRFHHSHINMSPGGVPGMSIFGYVTGVMDHIYGDLPNNAANMIRVYNGSSYGGLPFGDAAWNAETNFGGSDFLFIEDSYFNGGYGTDVNDSVQGAKWVWRFNTTTGLQEHGTGSNGRSRGTRAMEAYKNNFINTSGAGMPMFTAADIHSGTGLIWGNTFGTLTYNHFLVLETNRRDNSTYNQAATPDGWGYCGTSFNGTGSNWDQNSDVTTGYHCIDQVGRGIGDLLSGQFTGAAGGTGVLNSTRGCDSSMSCAYPRQAIEPIYEWLNVGTQATTYISAPTGADVIFENVDYYLYSSTATTSMTNQTTGVRSGTFANMPGSCTAGVTYFATDLGSWNQSGAGGQGVLYKCITANNFQPFYTPYTYPHPLVNPIDYLVFTVQPTDVSSGGTFSPTVVVTVTDPDGMTDTGATGNVTLTINACGASLSGTVTRAAVAGVATFTMLGATTASSGCILTASYTDVTPGTSSAFAVNGASAPTLSSIFPAISGRGQTIPVTLTGTNFNTGNADIVVSGTAFSVIPGSITVVSATTITARLQIAGNATTDVRTISVTTDAGGSGTVNFSILNQGLGVRRSGRGVRPR